MFEDEGPSNPDTAYERSDVPATVLLGIMLLVAVVVISAGAILTGIFPSTQDQRFPGPTKELPPSPRLEVNGEAALRRFNERVDRRLDSYGWVDRQHDIVHIPITVAMRQAAKTGFPNWPGNPNAAKKVAAQKSGATHQPEKPPKIKGATPNGSRIILPTGSKGMKQNGSAHQSGNPK
jgi:hypothetical protein